ncbi:MAG: DUF4097 family beta strand repeat-containing protein [Eubacteriales bacterium]
MSKTLKIIVLCAVVAVVGGMVLGGVLLVSGGLDREDTFTAHRESYATSLAGITTDLAAADVRLYQSDGEAIEVLFYDSEDQFFTLTEGEAGLHIERRRVPWYKDMWSAFYFRTRPYELEIGLPAGYTGTLVIETDSGNVHLEGLSLSSLAITASSGDIRLETVEAGALGIEVRSGNVRLTDVSAEANLSITHTSGDVRLERVSCGGDLSAVGGSGVVRIERVEAAGSVTLENSSGGMIGGEVRCGGTLSAKARSGNIRLEEVTAAAIDARCTSGNLRLRRMSADSIRLHAGSGNVNCSVTDSRARYTVLSRADSGSNDLPSGIFGTEKTLEVSTGSGNIHFEFDD